MRVSPVSCLPVVPGGILSRDGPSAVSYALTSSASAASLARSRQTLMNVSALFRVASGVAWVSSTNMPISLKAVAVKDPSSCMASQLQRVPALCAFWDLEKTVLHEICTSGTVLWSPTNTNSPTYTYISQKSW